MIKIQRSNPRPETLELLDEATQRLVGVAEQSGRQKRLKFDTRVLHEVRPELMEMCRGKCVYCESRLDVVSKSDVENFRPKAGARGLDKESYSPDHYWWLAFEWENLLVACQICNQKYKRDYFPLEDESLRCAVGTRGAELEREQPLIIDPTVDDPAAHIQFDRDGAATGISKRGGVTIEILGLNRSDLIEMRRHAAKQLEKKLETLQFTTDYSTDFAREVFEYVRELVSDSPPQHYAAIQRTVFNEWMREFADVWNSVVASHGELEEASGSTMRMNDDAGFEPSLKHLEPDTSSSEPATSGSEPTPEETARIVEQVAQLKRFSIESITIENFKSIAKLDLKMQASNADDGRESWMLLLGDNGIGKSSILQAIALALSTQEQLKRLDLNVLSYLRRGTDAGSVIIRSYEQSEPITLRFDASGFHSTVTEAPCFVLGYGSTRLLPKGNIHPESDREAYLNIANLFDYSVALRDPNEWLANLDPKEFEARVAPAFFDVLALRDGDHISIDNGKLNITQFGESHELEQNSDGFKTITALVSDIMQALSIEKANYHNSYGIVLIDEIGNHLHPRWRLKIASSLRRAFPKLQFIVTTHEPLCLRGLAYGEVTVLVRDQEQEVRALGKEVLPDHSLLRIDQLLTSDLFGLVNVYDEETEKTYEEYYELLTKPSNQRTDEEVKKIETYSVELSRKEVLGATPQMQATFELVNEVYAKKLREEGFKLHEGLKEETISEVKQILEDKELDWL